ncbi:hypothetical protein ABPG72_017203 [Tetrahymena utriculariae]
MKNITLIGLGLMLTLLAGSTVYLVSQNSKTGDLQDTANFLDVRDNFPFPSDKPQPLKNSFCSQPLFQISAETPCLKNNDQFKLPFNIPDQLKNSWQTYCK